MNRPATLFVCCLIAAPAIAAPGDDQKCPLNPVTASGYIALVNKNEEGVRGVMQRINCYWALLERATESQEVQPTIDVISLGVPGGVHSQEEYSEFLESLATKQPRKLLDSLLNVENKHVQDVIGLLREPLVTDKQAIDTSLAVLRNEEKYAPLLALYFAEKAK